MLEGALRKTFDCLVDTVTIEAHEDLGSSAAYAQAVWSAAPTPSRRSSGLPEWRAARSDSTASATHGHCSRTHHHR